MTNLQFNESLTANAFTSNNHYIFNNMAETNLRFYKDCSNLPFIMLSAWQLANSTVLEYSKHTNQLRNRLLNTAKIKEILDTSPVPLMISLKNKWYMMGKGFLAHVNNLTDYGDSLNLLFVACVDSSMRTNRGRLGISDIKFFFSRDIYDDKYKTLLPALKDIMLGHPGDVILTSNISDRVGDKIPFPSGGTLNDRMNYKREVMLECLREYFA